MWFGAAIFTVGAGLLYTLQVDSGAGMWIGYQILTGIGAGASVQIPFISVQVVLSAKDMPTGSELPNVCTAIAINLSNPPRCFNHFLQLPWRSLGYIRSTEYLLQYSASATREAGTEPEPSHYHRRWRYARRRRHSAGAITSGAASLRYCCH